MLTVAAVVARAYVLMDVPSCTATLRAILSRGERLSLPELRERTGNRWSSCHMSAQLAKMREAGEVIVLPAANGRARGQLYAASAESSGRRRARHVQPAGLVWPRQESPVHHSRAAGLWDGLIPASEACDA